MRLNRLRVSNFRNIGFADLEFSGTRVFLFGENAQGKTNLLEAASLLTAFRSFRTRELGRLVRHGEKLAQAAFELAHEREGDTRILLSLGSAGTKRVELGAGTPVARMRDFVGRFPAVVFAAEDVAVLRGAPALRRRWFDLTFSAADGAYLERLQRYCRALEARNRLLKAEADAPAQFAAFEKVLAENGAEIVAARERGVAELAARFAEIAVRILNRNVAAELLYAPSRREADAAGWEAFFERSRRTDRLFHATQKGPHRDDFRFRLDGRDAAEFASEGQQRGLSLALGLAQLSLLRERTGVAPIVLADDVLSELDPARKENFWRELGDGLQVVATGTVLPADAASWRIFDVREGKYFPR